MQSVVDGEPYMPILAAPAFFGNPFLELFAFRPCLIHKNYDRMCPYSKQEYKGGDRDGNNQKQGIGTRLLKAVMEKYESVYQMELLTDDTEKTVSFYRSAGFLSVEELGCKAFMRA